MPGTFTLEQKQVRRLRDDLEALSKRAVPHAVRNALNAIAFTARKDWGEQIKTKMVLRNKWTIGSLRVEKASGLTVASMQSRVGSAADYMKTQELGGVETAHGKHGVPIPTTTAAGQSISARPRTRQVQRKNWQSAIKLPGKVTGSRERRNAVALQVALKSGGVAFLDLGKRKGMFRATGGKGRMRVRMVWDMSKKTVATKPRATLEPTLKIIETKAPEIQKAALIEQFSRYHLGKGLRAGKVGFF